MKSRKEYVKKIRRLEILSSLFMILGTFISIVFHFKIFGLITIVVIFILFNIYIYSLMKQIRCRDCDNVDIFEKKFGFTYGIKSHCPRCNHKLKDKV